MADLIDRQAAIDAMKNMYQAAEKWGREASDDVIKARAESCMATLVETKLRIEELPAAQPRKGEWIDYSHEGYVECPFCHSATNCDGNIDDLHYCFSCGAELR